LQYLKIIIFNNEKKIILNYTEVKNYYIKLKIKYDMLLQKKNYNVNIGETIVILITILWLGIFQL
jgi:hypothetical protein